MQDKAIIQAYINLASAICEQGYKDVRGQNNASYYDRRDAEHFLKSEWYKYLEDAVLSWNRSNNVTKEHKVKN